MPFLELWFKNTEKTAGNPWNKQLINGRANNLICAVWEKRHAGKKERSGIKQAVPAQK